MDPQALRCGACSTPEAGGLQLSGSIPGDMSLLGQAGKLHPNIIEPAQKALVHLLHVLHDRHQGLLEQCSGYHQQLALKPETK